MLTCPGNQSLRIPFSHNVSEFFHEVQVGRSRSPPILGCLRFKSKLPSFTSPIVLLGMSLPLAYRSCAVLCSSYLPHTHTLQSILPGYPSNHKHKQRKKNLIHIKDPQCPSARRGIAAIAVSRTRITIAKNLHCALDATTM